MGNFIHPNFSMSIIFTKHNFIKYLKSIAISVLVLFIFEVFIVHLIYKNRIEYKINENIDIIKLEKTINKKILCAINKCDKLIIDNVVYVLVNNKLIKSTESINVETYFGTCFTKSFYTLININIDNHNIKILFDDKKYLYNIFKTILYNILIILIIFSITYFNYIYYLERSNIIEKRRYELELEGKLQRTITESAHHEMLMPLAVIKTLFYDFIKQMYPCIKNNSAMCNHILQEARNTIDGCDAKSFPYNRKVDNVAKDYFNKITLAIEQLESVLYQMSETKHIKYSNGNISIYELLTNALNALNTNSVSNLYLDIRPTDIKLLKQYAVKKPLNNGNILNIFNNHFTNSKEAKATVIKIKAIKKNDSIDIYLGDNGIGIRDKFNKIIAVDAIFNNGFSTKDKNGNSIVIENSLLNRLNRFIYELFNNSSITDNSSRGVGLYINKKILTKGGGDVVLVDTSTKGTVFKITLPVKKRVDH